MLKKNLFILFLFPHIVELRADEPFELELFQERVYQYFARDNDTVSCWKMYTDGLNGLETYPSNFYCNGEVLTCDKLGKSRLYVDANRKIRYVDAALDDYVHYYGTFIDDSLNAYWIYPEYGNLTHDYGHCHCRCFKDYSRIYVGEVRSWEDENYVIVGVRFRLQDDVLYLQIAEGILEANGAISAITWLPPPYNPSNDHSVNLNSLNIFLDDLTLDSSYALTGVKFEFMESDGIKGFGISISGVPFDFSTGKLDLRPENKRIIKPHSLTHRKNLNYKLINPIDKIASPLNRPSPSEYNFVKLQQSDFQTDFGQTTLPLFDSRSVMISPPTPLAGIGLLHNGTDDHAGFIALRVYPVY